MSRVAGTPMIFLLFVLSGAVLVLLALSARRLRDDGETDTVLYGFVTQLILFCATVCMVSVAFLILAGVLTSTSNDVLIDAAFKSEQRLIALRARMEYLEIPWPWLVLVFLILFVLSVPRARAHRAPSRLARTAIWLRKPVERYTRVVGAVNVVLAVMCSFSVFGAALDADAGDYYARLKGTREQLVRVASKSRDVADVEIKAAIVSKVLTTSPSGMRRFADAVIRLRTTADTARAERDFASRNLRIRWTPPSRSASAPVPAELTRPRFRNTTPRTAKADDSVLPARSFGDLDAMEDAAKLYAERPSFRDQATLIAELETRQTFTGTIVEKMVSAPLAAIVASAEWPVLGEVVAGIVLDAFAEAVNQRVDRAAVDSVVNAFKTGLGDSSDPKGESNVRSQATASVDANLSGDIRRAWENAETSLLNHVDALRELVPHRRDFD
jgi:hypothetical protein